MGRIEPIALSANTLRASSQARHRQDRLDCGKPIHQADLHSATGAPAGSARESSMRGIGKSSIATCSLVKTSLTMSAAFVLVAAVAILAPTPASAQFGGLDGILPGAMRHGAYGCR